MPTFVVTGPDGKKYKVTAPEGATDEEVKAKVQAEVGQQENPWGPDVFDAQGNPLGPEGGEGFDAQGKPLGLYGSGATAPKETPGLMAGIQNAAAAGLEGFGANYYDLPMDIAGGVEKGITYALTEGGGALADAVGAEGVADWWREAGGKRLEQLDNPNALVNQRFVDTIQEISPTPEGMEGARFAGQFIGGAMAPFGPKRLPSRPTSPASREVVGGTTIQPGWQPGPRAPTNPVARTAARETIEAGAENQIRVMTSDVRPPTTFTGKIARATGERIPFFGTGGQRAAQQGERVEAVKRLAQEYGYDEAATYLDDVTADLVQTRGNQLSNLTKAKDSVIDVVEGAAQAPRAIAEIDRQIAFLRDTVRNENVAPVIAELEKFKRTLSSGLSLRGIEENRKILGTAFDGDNMANIKDVGDKAIRAIYAPLRDDMGEVIRERAGDAAFNRWKGANDRLAAMAGELEDNVFKNVLRKAETTPEAVSRLLFSKNPSEVRRLVSNLSPEGLAKARAGIIHLAVEKAGGLDNISPDKFANAIAQNARAAGVVFSGDDLARLNGLQRVLQATKQASVSSAAPPTGVQNAPIIGGFAAGSMMDLGTSLATFGGAGALARLYESAATRNLLVGLSKTEPGSKAEGAILQRITSALAAQAEIQAGNAARAANENSIVAPLAAQDEPRQAN